jgi:uncharacterized protein YegJ (DUF2314 family)
MVKSKFKTDSGSYEHMWTGDLKFKDGVFSGALANKPADIKSLKAGDQVTIARSEVTDWIILSANGQAGGFTQAVLDKKEAGK